MAPRRWNWLHLPSSRGSQRWFLLRSGIYLGVLSSHAASRSEVVPSPAEPTPATPVEQDKPKNTSRYIRWSELLRRTFGFIVCSKCQAPLRMIALIKTEDIARKILKAMHLPTEIPELHPARPPRPPPGKTGDGHDCLN